MSNLSNLSPLQRYRLNFKPKLPLVLKDLKNLVPLADPKDNHSSVLVTIAALFPHSAQLPLLSFMPGKEMPARPLKVGIVFSGGQAPGGHNVISGVFDALSQLHPNSSLIGFLDGPEGIIQNKTIALTEQTIAPYRNQGGFDLIGSGRMKIETPDQFEAAEKTIRTLGLDGLIVIGGDDSNTNAAFLSEYFKKKNMSVCIAGVPKTIDGDLKNEFIEVSFGFDTACKIYSETIGNLAKDALSAKKYYFFVKLMGRSASHITLECALKTQVNLALIGEEIRAKKQTLNDIIGQIADMICERAAINKNYGVILIPEGIIEFFDDFSSLIIELNQILHLEPKLSKDQQLTFIESHLKPSSWDCFNALPDDIKGQLLLERDPHGNIQVSKIETERLFIHLVAKELQKRKQMGKYTGKFDPQAIFCGYEGRTGLPSNFDCQYCYALGYVATLLVHSGSSGYMGCLRHLNEPVEKWEVQGIPLVQMLSIEKRKGREVAVLQKYLVNLGGVAFDLFKKKRHQWLLEDHYLCPGPMQFEGPSEITNLPPLSLLLENENRRTSKT